jgi:hypothetical protein
MCALSGADGACVSPLHARSLRTSPENASNLRLAGGAPKQLPVYRKFVADCLWPDPMRKRAKVRIAEAKRAIGQCERATGDAAGTAELILTFVEQGTGFAADLGYGDEDFFSSLVACCRAPWKASKVAQSRFGRACGLA